MKEIKAKQKYVLTFPKDENGEDILYRFMLTIDRKFDKTTLPKFEEIISKLPGIDKIEPYGMYSIEIMLARTYDPVEIIEELKESLENYVLTEIERVFSPKIVR